MSDSGAVVDLRGGVSGDPPGEAPTIVVDEKGYLGEVFGDGGLLAKSSPTYKKRAGQVTMTTGVHDAIVSDEPLLAEAATGTGKSFGYLVPAIRAVTDPVTKAKLLERRTVVDEEAPVFRGSAQTCEESPRVLVVTAGLNLQDQLVSKDLPFLRKILPWPFKFQVAKGKNNYACLSKIHGTNVFEIDDEDGDQWSEINEWLKRSPAGDFSELPFEVRPSLKRHVSVSAEECHGSHCSYYRNCYAVQARERAGQAEVVVANFHVFLSHLSVAKAGDGTSIVPRYDILILDEVHELPGIARKFLGFRIHAGMLKEPLKLITGKKPIKADVEREVDAFFSVLGAYKRSGNYKARLKDPMVFPYEPLNAVLVRLAEQFQKEANDIGSEEDAGPDEGGKREQNELRKAAAKLKERAKFIEQACLLEDSERTVYYISEERVFGQDRFSLCGEPIDPASLLRAMILEGAGAEAEGEAGGPGAGEEAPAHRDWRERDALHAGRRHGEGDRLHGREARRRRGEAHRRADALQRVEAGPHDLPERVAGPEGEGLRRAARPALRACHPDVARAGTRPLHEQARTRRRDGVRAPRDWPRVPDPEAGRGAAREARGEVPAGRPELPLRREVVLGRRGRAR